MGPLRICCRYGQNESLPYPALPLPLSRSNALPYLALPLSLTLKEREREPIPINPPKKENVSHKRWLSYSVVSYFCYHGYKDA